MKDALIFIGCIVIGIAIAVVLAMLLVAGTGVTDSRTPCYNCGQPVFTKNITILDTEYGENFNWNPFYLYSTDRMRYEIPGKDRDLYEHAKSLVGCNVAITYTCQGGHYTISAILPLSCPQNPCGCGYQPCEYQPCGCGCAGKQKGVN